MFDLVLGLAMLSYAGNIFILAMGRLAVGVPPIVGNGAPGAADPLPQALVLTAIVIGLATTAFTIALALVLSSATGADRVDCPEVSEDSVDHDARGGGSSAPAFACAVVMMLLGERRRGPQRALGVLSCGALSLIALAAVAHAASGAIEVYRVGNWPAPFGITLVARSAGGAHAGGHRDRRARVAGCRPDREAAWDTRGRHFHPLFQLQLMGLNGAFLTGDLFNLFVFFEVLLVASFGLLLHGRGEPRLRAGLHYVAINLVASTVFVVAVALLYGLTGALNLAELALRVPQVPPGDAPLVRAAGADATGRLYREGRRVPALPLASPGLCFGAAARGGAVRAHDQGRRLRNRPRARARVRAGRRGRCAGVGPWLLGGAVATAALGALGAFGAQSLARMIAYLTLTSVGTLLIAVGHASTASLSAGLYYLIHSAFIIAALFLLSDAITVQRGGEGFERSVPVAQPALLGGLFVIGAASVAACRPCPGSRASSRSCRPPAPRPPCHFCGVCSWARGCSR